MAKGRVQDLPVGNRGNEEQAAALVAVAFEEYGTMRAGRMGKTAAAHEPDPTGALGHFLRDFITLLQSASFLARGRDR